MNAGVPVIALDAVDKTYGSAQHPVPVLRAVHFRVMPGEFVAIVGASGSGKSTLLNILGCLDRPTRGAYRLVGQDIATLSDLALSHLRKTRIGFVFQSFHLVQHLTVAGERRAAAVLRPRAAKRQRRERSHGDPAARRPRPPHHPPAEPAVGRRVPAHRGGPRPRQRAGADPRRRADRQPRFSKTSARSCSLFRDLHGGPGARS
jgi:hypothetical protein